MGATHSKPGSALKGRSLMRKRNQKQTDQCVVCANSNLEPLFFGYSRHNPRLFHRVAVCRDCGHIQLYPLFREDEYAIINDRFFEKQYMVGDHENVENNSKKLRKMDERLSLYLRDGLNILDVGAGEAWTMEYFQQKNCNYFAIEAVDRLASLIHERGGKVIGKSIFDNYSKYESRFDIIIFRHVLEHLLNPTKALLALRNLLNTDGLIYLALPNASNPSIHKGFRTSFVRPVHVSYFCEGNVLRLAHSVGLDSTHSESIGEIFCLLKHGSNEDFENENYYMKQKEVFLMKGKQALIKDFVKIIRDLPKALARRLLHEA